MHVHLCMCIYKHTCERTYTDINTHWYTMTLHKLYKHRPAETMMARSSLSWLDQVQVRGSALGCCVSVPGDTCRVTWPPPPPSPRRQCYSDLQCAPSPALLSRDLFSKRVLIPGVRLPESAVPPVRKQDRGSAELEGPTTEDTTATTSEGKTTSFCWSPSKKGRFCSWLRCVRRRNVSLSTCSSLSFCEIRTSKLLSKLGCICCK